MKELSIEEKAQRYDEAIKKVNDYYEGKTKLYSDVDKTLNYLFPALKESEDMIMVKFIKNQLFNIKKTITENYELDAKLTKAIDWFEKQGNLMKALQISNARIGELIEKNYYLKEQLEKQRKNNMGISEATKQKLEDNLNKALEKETPESWNKFLDEQKSEDKVAPRQYELTEFEKAVKQVMEEAIECGDTHNLKADADLLLRIAQKTTWSEEDERNLDWLITVCERIHYKSDPQVAPESALILRDWLKSLKNRVQPQQEWSEEDERITEIKTFIAQCNGFNSANREKVFEMLDALKDRYVWKPSDEQMDALHYVTNFDYGGHKATLVSLYEQLKKLKG